MSKQIVVIYDGQCEFCQASIDWIEQKLIVHSKAFQEADLASYGLTIQQCSQSVHVIAEGKILVGATAIAYLLKERGDSALSFLITASGPIGRFGYQWIAAHRNTFLIKVAHRLLDQSNSRYEKKRKS
jgi:predicted DCC family thiol-disulfide oxidoreductase YuxK